MKIIQCFSVTMILFVSSFFYAQAETEIPLGQTLNTGITARPTKAPGRPLLSYHLYIDNDCTVLVFQSSIVPVGVSYRLFDENDQMIRSGKIIMDETNEEMINISTFPIGTYRIEIEINGVFLYGEFEIE